jgi:hypothetical protein
MSHWHTARIYMKLSQFEDTLKRVDEPVDVPIYQV